MKEHPFHSDAFPPNAAALAREAPKSLVLDVQEVRSTVDNTIKFVSTLWDGVKVEASYINKNDGKDIICAPTQTSCRVGCKFCFLTAAGNTLKYRSLSGDEILAVIEPARKHCKTGQLLVSFMGAGEPMLNEDGMVDAAKKLRAPNVRFAFATALPVLPSQFIDFAERVKLLQLNFKAHLSLHFTLDDKRNKYMPASRPIAESVTALRLYREITRMPIEIHYTLIKDVNDFEGDASRLAYLAKEIPIKLLKYEASPGLPADTGGNPVLFSKLLYAYDAEEVEIYSPPGSDVGASCGQFFVEDLKRG